jgi:hypothetical protein
MEQVARKVLITAEAEACDFAINVPLCIVLVCVSFPKELEPSYPCSSFLICPSGSHTSVCCMQCEFLLPKLKTEIVHVDEHQSH